MTPQKPAIRVRAVNGRPLEWKKLHAALGGQSFVRVYAQAGNVEFMVTADSNKQIEGIRAKLGDAGVEEIPGGETTIATHAPSRLTSALEGRQGGPENRGGPQHRGWPQRQERRSGPGTTNARPLPGKPYGFVALSDDLKSAAPVWLDGTSGAGRLSGEVRFELKTLTPLLVGWERGLVGEGGGEWPVPLNLGGVGQLSEKKSVLCPLRAPWGPRPVVIPGDSLKGLLRHELGALLGAPMERVAERSYSYRPNLKFPDKQEGRFLEPRLARVRTTTTVDVDGKTWPVPEVVDVLSMATRDEQRYYPRRERGRRDLVHPTPSAEPYKGGMGGGQALPDAVLSEDARHKTIHTHLDVGELAVEHASTKLRETVTEAYKRTLKHLLDEDSGHFSARHPNLGTDRQKQRLGRDAVRDAAARAFQPADLIWVEWDTEEKRIVSFGWHYYYRWAYADSVRKEGCKARRGLFPLDQERDVDGEGAPKALTLVRRLFGYTGDNEGSSGIGACDHAQLMGRISVNAGLEVVEDGDADDNRFLPPTFLKELGMPRPSAVEHYLKQPYHPRSRPSDKATLVTYCDAAGYDAPGGLAGRKFYLDRKDAYSGEPWKDDSPANRANDRSTLALEASRPGCRFRFTVRFRDLDAAELAAIFIALCPNQFREVLGGQHADGYCSKLGYARPLGLGTVQIEAKALLFLECKPALRSETDILGWVRRHHQQTATQAAWLGAHRHKHPDAADYPRVKDRDGNENIYTFHTALRAEHTRARRYRNGGSR